MSDRRRVLAGRLRLTADRIDADGTFGGRIVAEELREAADLLEGCLCAMVKVGGHTSGARNWNPDCPVHPWDERLQAQSDRAVEWQLRAKAARKARIRDGET